MRNKQFVFTRYGIGWMGLVPRLVFAENVKEMPACRVSLIVKRAFTGVTAKAVVRNTGKHPVRIKAIRWVSDISGGSPKQVLKFPHEHNPFYFSTENFRGESFGTSTTLGNTFFEPLSNQDVTIGSSEDWVFPGVFIGSSTKPLGIFCAAASQERFSVRFRFHGGSERGTWNFEIEQYPQGLEWLKLPPGKSISSDLIFFDIVKTNDPQFATDSYYKLLRSFKVFNRLKNNPLFNQRIWCSWNFGYLDKISEYDILRQIPVICAKFPMVKFVQIDNGYERVYPSGQRAQIDLLYGKDVPYNKKTFPNGLEYIVKKIKDAGLRPAIWAGLWASGTSPMIKDNPDWILLDDTGRQMKIQSHFGAVRKGPHELAVLDISVPAVKRYLERLARVLFKEWGFEGIKLDFSSFNYNIRRARFRYGNETAAVHLKWIVKTFRKYLPKDGFFGWCSAVGTGTPFYGNADYFRYAEDIGDGSWSMVKRIALWTVNMNMLLRQRPVIPNIDSIGFTEKFSTEKFSREEWLSFLSLCAVTGNTVEIAGDLTRLDNDKIWFMNRCLELSDNRSTLKCIDIPKDRIESPPSLWVSERDKNTRLIAIINWMDKAAAIDTILLDKACSNWKKKLKTVWENNAKFKKDSVILPAHGSVLLE